MKQHRIRLLTMFVISIALAGVSVQAQSPGHVVVEIPFPFTAGNSTFPAGHYWIKPDGPNLLTIQSTDGYRKATVFARSLYESTPDDRGKLIFNRYSRQYFLAQVWAPGNTVGRALYRSNVERESTRRTPTPQMVLRLGQRR